MFNRKHQFFFWRLLLNRLVTRDALFRRGILVSNRDLCCALCFKEIESTSHLFCNYEVSMKVWSSVFRWLGPEAIQNGDMTSNFMEFGGQVKGKSRRGVKHLIQIAVMWNLLGAKNKVVFKGEALSVGSIVISIKYTAWSWFIARKGRNSGVTLSNWLNCPMGFLLSV